LPCKDASGVLEATIESALAGDKLKEAVHI
jgi:hypothetical protein